MLVPRKGVVNGKWDPLYQAWRNMRGRCLSPNRPDYAYYGARGITVWPAWASYEQFAADVGPHPGVGWTLDRIDNDKGYLPGNVRWATRLTQSRNRPYCRVMESDKPIIRKRWASGERQIDIAADYGVTQLRISQICRGK